MKIERALVSVSDKSDLAAFCQGLADLGIELLSTGGTATFLRDAGLAVTDVSAHTGFPELFDGRVKTLHPKIHGGLLFQRGNETHRAQAEAHSIPSIDLLVVNLYPFEQTVAKEGVTLDEGIEQIDVGGPAMLRAAAKNFQSVTIVCDPADYETVLAEIREQGGDTTLRTRERLAVKVFQRTAEYDQAIARYLGGGQAPDDSFTLRKPLYAQLRYGDNPHQAARLYGNFGDYFEHLQGKDLSYTNVLDIDAAADLINEFRKPTVAILKHTNPCGVGSDDDDLRAAWD